MFNNYEELEKRVREVEDEVLGEKQFLYWGGYGRCGGIAKTVPIIGEQIDKLQSKFDLLLKHFELEYHKITDENGSTKVKEVYKKAKKVKKSKKNDDYDDED